MASTMTDGFDVVDFLHGVSVSSVELLDCEGAGLLLAGPDGALALTASSSVRTDALELLQAQAKQGPGFDSWVTGFPVISESLAADRARWPVFAPLAVEKGFASIHAVPMRAAGRTLGSLNLFRARPGRIAAADLPLAQGMADLAAVALLQERSLRESRGVVEQLRVALTSRVVIEQAKGALAERAQIGVDAAFARLRAHARAQNRRLIDVASDLIDGSLDAAALRYSRAGKRPPAGSARS